MDDLISRQETLSILSNLNSAWVGYEKVSRLPTIDAVPVVRCKDCKYYEQNDDDYEGEQGEDSWGVCENTGAGMMRCGYCSDGERKDDETDS